MPHIAFLSNAAATHTLVRRSSSSGYVIPLVVIIVILVLIALGSWIRIVRRRHSRFNIRPQTYMAAANPIGRVRRYEPEPPQPRRPRTPPALRPRTENTYVRRPEPSWSKPRAASTTLSPPVYTSQTGTPLLSPSSSDAPLLDAASVGTGAAVVRTASGQELPPPYNPPS